MRSEYCTHPVRKGNRAWGKEFNEGDILFITSLSVEKDSRRKGIGRKMVENIWAKPQAMSSTCQFAVTLGTYQSSEVPPEMQNPWRNGPPSTEASAIYTELQLAAEDFWRAVGFRMSGCSGYYGFTSIEDHPSRSISVSDDYRQPHALRIAQRNGDQVSPYSKVMVEASDSTTLEIHKARLQEVPANDTEVRRLQGIPSC